MDNLDRIMVAVDELQPEVAKAVDFLVKTGNPIKEIMEGDLDYDPCICLKSGKDIQFSIDGTYCLTEMDGDCVNYLVESKDFDKILEALAGF